MQAWSTPPEEPRFDKIAKDYVDFVASLPAGSGKSPLERIVVGAYPSSLEKAEDVPQSIAAYGVLTEEQAATIDLADSTLAKRQGRVKEFNVHLKAACEASTCTPKVTYVDVFDELVDPDTLMMRSQFLDISVMNIHVVWETTILLWLERLPHILGSRVPPGFRAQMQRSLDKYLVEKEQEMQEKGLSMRGGEGEEAAVAAVVAAAAAVVARAVDGGRATTCAMKGRPVRRGSDRFGGGGGSGAAAQP